MRISAAIKETNRDMMISESNWFGRVIFMFLMVPFLVMFMREPKCKTVGR